MPIRIVKQNEVKYDASCVVVCFPVISSKEITENDSEFLKEAYTMIPSGNYYSQYDKVATVRGKPGTISVHYKPASKNTHGIINMFIRLYHGNKTHTNDNVKLRLKYFKQCLEKLLTYETLKIVHFEPIPVEDRVDGRDFIDAIDDFSSTYSLNFNRQLDIIVHDNQPLAIDDEAILTCDEDQISDQPLYEVDFVRYVFIK